MFPRLIQPSTPAGRAAAAADAVQRVARVAVAFATLEAVVLPEPDRGATLRRAGSPGRPAAADHRLHPHRHPAALPERRRRPGAVPAAAQVCVSPVAPRGAAGSSRAARGCGATG